MAFVRFSNHEQALDAIHHLHGERVSGHPQQKRLTVRFATCQHKKGWHHKREQPLGANPNYAMNGSKARRWSHGHHGHGLHLNLSLSASNDHNLYIKNLPKEYNQLSLERLFSEFGPISSATIINDSIGVAFVRYKKAEDARRAIKQLNGTKPPLFEKEIVVKFAHSDIEHAARRQPPPPRPARPRGDGHDAEPPAVMVRAKVMVSGFVRVHSDRTTKRQQLLLLDEKTVSLIWCYLREAVDEEDAVSFNELLCRINLLNARCCSMERAMFGVTEQLNSLLTEAEQKRLHEMKAMHAQFDGVISSLYHRMQGQLQSMANTLAMNQQDERERIEALELRVESVLNSNRNRDGDGDGDGDCDRNRNRSAKQMEMLEMEMEDERLRFLHEWLSSTVRLPQYFEVFVKNGLDEIAGIGELTEGDLVGIGISKMGHRRKMLKYAQSLRWRERKRERERWSNCSSSSLFSPPWTPISYGSHCSNNKQIEMAQSESPSI